MPYGMWDLCSPIRGQTNVPALEVLTTGPRGKSLHAILRGQFNLVPLCIALYLSSFHSSSVEFITLYYSYVFPNT